MPETFFFFKQRKSTEEKIEKYSECINIKVHACVCVCKSVLLFFVCVFFFLRELKEISEGEKRTLLREARETQC